MNRRPSRDRRLVLVVDDEAHILRSVASILEPFEFEVIQAGSSSEAYSLYEHARERIAGVILDLVMPEQNGEQVFTELRARDPELRVLLSSGHHDHAAIARITSNPGTAFLAKPYQPAELVLAVEKLLG